MVRILIEAGATPLSAVRTADALERGGSIRDAWELIEIAPEPPAFDPVLVAAEITRARELVLVGRGQ